MVSRLSKFSILSSSILNSVVCEQCTWAEFNCGISDGGAVLTDGIRLWILALLSPSCCWQFISTPVECSCICGIWPLTNNVADLMRSTLSTLPWEKKVDRALDNLRGWPELVSSADKTNWTISSSYRDKFRDQARLVISSGYCLLGYGLRCSLRKQTNNHESTTGITAK